MAILKQITELNKNVIESGNVFTKETAPTIATTRELSIGNEKVRGRNTNTTIQTREGVEEDKPTFLDNFENFGDTLGDIGNTLSNTTLPTVKTQSDVGVDSKTIMTIGGILGGLILVIFMLKKKK